MKNKNILIKLIESLIGRRLDGVTLVVPVINFWWPSFPPKLTNEVFGKQLKRDQWKLRIAHYAPGLLYWWMTQKWFPRDSVMERHPILSNKRDMETIKQMSQVHMPHEVQVFHLDLNYSHYIHYSKVVLTLELVSILFLFGIIV